ncbi:hypothetical protein FQN60_014591 [Etheostoma spectabile]|uniref:Uncharacterized protein n=1 Tax=Etheostoma spectabile TaxID=54343 RepID=A0A5J5D951_9PERO|nr:hypothetical protein FQN60_014591 [Etheostoma spectabile]
MSEHSHMNEPARVFESLEGYEWTQSAGYVMNIQLWSLPAKNDFVVTGRKLLDLGSHPHIHSSEPHLMEWFLQLLWFRRTLAYVWRTISKNRLFWASASSNFERVIQGRMNVSQNKGPLLDSQLCMRLQLDLLP